MGERDRVAEAKRLAERRAQRRARRVRDGLVRNVDVLDELIGGALPARPGIGDVAGVFGVDVARIQAVVRRHPEELRADGWRPSGGSVGEGQYWPPRAIVRAGLLLDGPVAEELRYRLGQGQLPVVYSTSAARVLQCRALFERVNRIVEHVHDTCTDSLWRELATMDRYQLQALVVAMAALVPLDRGGLARWLVDMSALDGRGGSAARGLAMLIPEPAPCRAAGEGGVNGAAGSAGRSVR